MSEQAQCAHLQLSYIGGVFECSGCATTQASDLVVAAAIESFRGYIRSLKQESDHQEDRYLNLAAENARLRGELEALEQERKELLSYGVCSALASHGWRDGICGRSLPCPKHHPKRRAALQSPGCPLGAKCLMNSGGEYCPRCGSDIAAEVPPSTSGEE